jgi:hypothetical protein
MRSQQAGMEAITLDPDCRPKAATQQGLEFKNPKFEYRNPKFTSLRLARIRILEIPNL